MLDDRVPSPEASKDERDDDVVSLVRAQLPEETAVSPGQPREADHKVEMEEMRVSRSPWVVRGLIGMLLVLLVAEIVFVQQTRRPAKTDVSHFESGPTIELLDTPAPDLASIAPPAEEAPEDPPLEMLPEPPTPTPLPTPG